MSRYFMPFIALFLAAVVATGCGVEGQMDEANVFERARVAEVESRSHELTAGDADAAAAEDADASETPCEWVTAVVCVGEVCVTMRAWRCGNTLTVNLPVDSSLIGLPITAVANGVTYTGTYR